MKRARLSIFRLLIAIVACAAVVLSAATLAACGGDGETEPAGTEARGGDGDGPGALVVYTYDAFPEAATSLITKHFGAEYGVEVTVQRFADTGGLFNQAYLERDEPKADVVIGLDNTYVGRALDEEMFEPYKPESLRLVNDRLLIDPEYRLVPFDYGGITLNYDSSVLSDPPESWEELLDPRFRDSIVLMNPATSSPGRNFLLFTIAEHGEKGFLDYWEKLEPNILTVTGGWSEGYGLYTQGEAPIVLSYETSPAYHIHYEDETKYKNILFEKKAYIQVELAGIVAGAPNRSNARRLMEFIVGREFQALIPLNQIMYPVHPDVELPEAFQRIERAETLISMDERAVSEKMDEWLRAWESVMR